MEAEATPVISGKDLQTVFKSFDKDNSGTIELTELRSVIT
jgi:Ca2+-binding EF-hand superfamily protein